MGKTIIFDIETSPIIVPTFSLWGEVGGNHKSILQDWYVISVAWKTLGEKKVHAVSVLDDAKRFNKDHTDDYHVVKTIHEVLNDADLIIGHNICKFDWKKLNTRFIKHGLKPLAKKKMSDTYKTAKREFNFTSNRLDYIAGFLGLEVKMETPKGLWLEVLKGSREAVKTMVKYNKQDIVVSEQVYLKLRPYDTAPVNLSVGSKKSGVVCPKCGGNHVHKMGTVTLTTGEYQKFQCRDCGGWFRDKVNLLTTAAKKAVTVAQ